MKRYLTLILACLISSYSLAASNSCDDIEIADMGWNSATLIAHVDQFILEHGYGCRASLVPANTQATGMAILEKGKPEIIPEFWGNSMKKAMADAITEDRIHHLGSPLADGAVEGFWVPRYMSEKHTELVTILGVIKSSSLFSPADKSEPAPFYGCPKGWNCHISSMNLFKALKLEQANFEYITPRSGAELEASLAQAYENKAPWFGYYWSPTAPMARFPMTQVNFQTGIDVDEFERCTSKADCTDPKVTMYPTPLVQTLVTAGFARDYPAATKYLSRRSWSDEQIIALLAWMENNQADGDVAMEHFLKNNQEVWMKWVNRNAVKSIKKALNEL